MMITKIKIALVLCLSLMLWVGSAAGDQGDFNPTMCLHMKRKVAARIIVINKRS